MMRKKPFAVLIAFLMVIGGTASLSAVLLDGGSGFWGSDSADPAGASGPGSASTTLNTSNVLEAQNATRILAALTGVDLGDLSEGNLLERLSSMEDLRTDELASPGSVLRAAGTAMGVDASTYPPVPASPSLTASLDRYAQAVEQEPLNATERSVAETLPAPIRDALTPAIDALTYATTEQRAALAELSSQDQLVLLQLAARTLPSTDDSDPLTQTEASHLAKLTERVDVARLVHASTVLTDAAMETHDRLKLALEELRGQAPLATSNLSDAQTSEDGPGDGASSKLRTGAAILRARSHGGGLQADPGGTLTDQLHTLVTSQYPGLDIAPTVDGAEILEGLPADLHDAVFSILAAYNGPPADPQAPGMQASAHDRATDLLETLADLAPTLERWSLILSNTPPDLHFRTPEEIAQRRAGLALTAPARATTLEDALRLGAGHAGLSTSFTSSPVSPPAASDALAHWYDAFGIDVDPSEQQAALSAIDELPDHVAQAAAVLLAAQVSAYGILQEATIDAADQRLLREAAPVVSAVLSGHMPAEHQLGSVEAFQDLSTTQSSHLIDAGLLLAGATDQARAILEAAQNGDEDEPGAPSTPPPPSHPPEGPDTPNPRGPGAPDAGLSPEGPFADPGNDVWFEDPSGLILITGQGRSHYPAEHYALTIDLGGNDRRADNAGGVNNGQDVPIAISIDMGGDDRYDTEKVYAQGAAAILDPDEPPAIGILADYRGDDVYRAGPFSQGASFLGGLGILLDVSGDDTYQIEGSSSDLLARFEVAGGQGYALAAPGIVDALYPPALGLHSDVAGHDAYEAPNGQGSAISLGDERMTTTGVRSATAMLIEGLGEDTYTCEGVCLGWGRIGTPQGLECGGPSGPCEPGVESGLTAFNPNRPGNVLATGAFIDTGGHDTYEHARGKNNRIGPTETGMLFSRTPGGFLSTTGVQFGFRVNHSTTIDAGLTDSNGDGVPDLVAHSLGHDPRDRDDGPWRSPWNAIDPVGLAAGPDRDGDAFSDSLEERLGTDPNDAGSAPVDPMPGGNGSGKLVDIRLELSTGTAATGSGLQEDRAPAGKIVVRSIGDNEFDPRDHYGAPGLDSEGTRLPLLAIGDTVSTTWVEDYPIALDLGGDDRYANNAGAAFRPSQADAVTLDHLLREAEALPDVGSSGEKLARQGVDQTPANTRGGLSGFLVDVGGHDVYESSKGPAQGAGAFTTFGLLIDLLGDDRYIASEAAQGSAIGPSTVGALLDLAGADSYEAKRASQGFSSPSCSTASQLIGDLACMTPASCETRGGEAGGPVESTCKTSASTTRATGLLLDFSGADTYDSDGQGILEPRDPTEGLCQACEPIPSRAPVVTILQTLPPLGAYETNPSRNALPAPLNDNMITPTGDGALFLDLDGADTYIVPGPRSPNQTQGYARGIGIPGQGQAVFLDAAGLDTYAQRDGQGLVTHDKNNHVILHGAPGDQDAEFVLGVFLDADADPEQLDRDGDQTPDLVESIVGARTVEEDRHEGPTNDTTVDLQDESSTGPLDQAYPLFLSRLGVIVGGTEANVHTEPANLLIDLGGADRYKVPVGAGLGDIYSGAQGPAGAALSIDIGGNVRGIDLNGAEDVYNTTVVDLGGDPSRLLVGASQGAGVLGIGVHVDPSGRDVYNVSIQAEFATGRTSLGLAQGAGFQGVGVLVASPDADLRTELRTNAPPTNAPPSFGLAQGAGWDGIGLLYVPYSSGGGNDYNLTVEPEGLARGGGQGFAASGAGLLIDPSGRDTFNATGAAQGSSMAASFEPATNGDGNGFNTRVNNPSGEPREGGLGLLVSGGSAAFNSACLSQGAGLGLGQLGALVDLGGDDAYELGPCSEQELPPMGQGAGAVGGTGLLLDRAGNDTLTAGRDRSGRALAQGAAMQGQSIVDGPGPGFPTGLHAGLLVDLDGQDRYISNGTASQGATTARVDAGESFRLPFGYPLGVLYDADGDDTYEPVGNAVGDASGALGIIQEAAGTALFIDGAGADTYTNLPHPGSTSLRELGVCGASSSPSSQQTGSASTAPGGAQQGEPVCPSPNGQGNDQAWSRSLGEDAADAQAAQLNRTGFGVDAPTRALAHAAAGRLLAGQASLTGERIVELRILDEACNDTLPADQPVNGTLCIEARVDPGVEQGGVIDRIRFLAIDEPGGAESRVRPALIEEQRGAHPDERSGSELVFRVTPWNTSQPEFLDGNTTVRVDVVLDEPSGLAREPFESQAAQLRDETRIWLDNPPWITVDAPRWHNPESGLINVTVLAQGDTERLQGQATNPCNGASLPLFAPGGQDPVVGVRWNLSLDLSGCDTSDQALNVTLTDEYGQIGYAQEHAIGIDRVRPSIRLDAPDAVNATVGSRGGFIVAWNATDRFGDIVEVRADAGFNGRSNPWILDAPTKGQREWQGFAHGDRIEFSFTAVDEAGNEGRGTARIPVDLHPPRLNAPSVEPQFIRSEDAVTFNVNVTESERVQLAQVVIDGTPFQLSSAGRGSDDQVQYTFTGWNRIARQLVQDQGENASRPEGYAYRFIVEDAAGNRATTIEDQVFIDEIPPTIEQTLIEYPGGSAAAPGDLLRLTVHASDNLQLAETMQADVSNLAEDGTVILHRDPSTLAYTGSFVLNKAPDPSNASLELTVQDAAGNAVVSEQPVAIATTKPTVTPVRTLGSSPTGALLHWRSDAPSTARVILTDPSNGEQLRFETNETTTNHTFQVTGLEPATTYQGELVPFNGAGAVGDERSFTLVTPSAIHVRTFAPEPGGVFSGSIPASVQASDPSDQPITATLQLVSTDPKNPLQRTIGEHELLQGREANHTLDVSGIPDGTYALHVHVERGQDRNLTVIENVTVDNSAPFIRILWPKPGSTIGPGNHTLTAAVLDPLAGVDPGSVNVTVGHRTFQAHKAADGSFQASIHVPAEGPSSIWVEASDRTGNTAREGGPLRVDPDAAEGAGIQLKLPGAQSAVKPGDRVEVDFQPGRSTAQDVVLSPSSVTGTDPIELSPARGWRGSFTVPQDPPEGRHAITLETTDDSGTVTLFESSIRVDRTTPAITTVEVLEERTTLVVLHVCANEPVDLVVDTVAEHGRARSDPGGHASCQQIPIQDLRPSRTYELRIAAEDRAGHATVTNITVATVADDVPPRPVPRLHEPLVGDRSITLTWDPSLDDTGIDHYEIHRRQAGEASSRLHASADGTRYTDTSVQAGETYHYAIRPVDLAGNEGEPSHEIQVDARGAPVLSAGRVTPTIGGPETTFTFLVNYTGPLEPTTEVLVNLDGALHEMELVGDPDTCADGCVFQHRAQLDVDELGSQGHRFSFQAIHDGFTAHHPPGAPTPGPDVLEKAPGAGVPAAVYAIAGGIVGLASLGVLATVAFRRFGGGLT